MSCESIDKALLSLYENGTWTDVQFLVKKGDEWITYRAHKLVLSIWSPLFADMFEANGIQKDIIEITDFSSSVFSVMLRFIYGSRYELHRMSRDVNFLFELYKAGKEYQITALEFACKNILSAMTPDKNNVFQLLEAARTTDAETTQLRCIHLLETRTEEILADHSNLEDITLDSVRSVLDLKRVSVSSEAEIVKWMFEWARAVQEKSKNGKKMLRNILNDVLGHVDLAAMKAEEFGMLMAEHEGVFTDSEGCKIFRNIVSPGHCNLPDWASEHIGREYNYVEHPVSKHPTIIEQTAIIEQPQGMINRFIRGVMQFGLVLLNDQEHHTRIPSPPFSLTNF